MPVKIILLVVGMMIVLLVYVTVSEDLLTGVKSPVNSLIDAAIGGVGSGG